VAISPELLQLLVCPADRHAVRLTADGAGLKCEHCLRIYPVRDEIPVMLIDEATVDPLDALGRGEPRA
jgi:uncharacterized protein YbaR (Trm112 family)